MQAVSFLCNAPAGSCMHIFQVTDGRLGWTALVELVDGKSSFIPSPNDIYIYIYICCLGKHASSEMAGARVQVASGRSREDDGEPAHAVR